MELANTVSLMNSKDYKKRFKAEYYQLKIRYDKLRKMIGAWDKGTLDFTPTCDRKLYDKQLGAMRKYLDILKQIAELEEIKL